MIRSDLFAFMINKGIKNIHISGWFPTYECYYWSIAVSNKCWFKTRRSTSAADDSWIHQSWAPPLIAAPGWAGSTRVKLPAMGRVDGWMLLGLLIRGVGPWPHQSGQTRQGPDSVTRAGWLVRWGAPVRDLWPGCVQHASERTQDYQSQRALNTKISFNFLTMSQRTAAARTHDSVTEKWILSCLPLRHRHKVAHFPEASSTDVASETQFTFSGLSFKE